MCTASPAIVELLLNGEADVNATDSVSGYKGVGVYRHLPVGYTARAWRT